MKIDSNILYDFVKKITLNGNIDEISLIIDGTGCKTRMTNASGTIMITAMLKKECFIDYKPLTERISFSNTSLLLNILKSFNGEIELETKENYILFKGPKKKVRFMLLDNSLTDRFMNKSPDFVYEGSFVLSHHFFDSILKSVNTLKQNSISFKCKDNILTAKIGNEKFHGIEETIEIEFNDFKTNLGIPFIETLPILTSSTIEVFIKTDYPLTLKEVDENSIIKYIIAPIAGDDE